MAQPAFNQEACLEKHRSISWMFGTLISLQLLCFSWLGYLSTRVINLENNYANSVGTITAKLDAMDKKLDSGLGGVDKKLDTLGTSLQRHFEAKATEGK